MIRSQGWEQVGGMREQFGLLADIDMWMRLAMRGPVGFVPDPIYYAASAAAQLLP